MEEMRGVSMQRLEDRDEQFVAVSAALTGFDRVELLGTGLTKTYLATLEQWIGPNIANDLLAFGTEPPPDERTVRAGILADAKLGPVARTLIALWYTGAWNPLPSEWYLAFRAEIPQLPNLVNRSTYVVSAQAYIEGLVWVAANVHPMGAKEPGYGTWEEEPKGARR
jgi:hypothetical protein